MYFYSNSIDQFYRIDYDLTTVTVDAKKHFARNPYWTSGLRIPSYRLPS
ncbi:hypothetical protein [Microcoleus sp. B4-C1]